MAIKLTAVAQRVRHDFVEVETDSGVEKIEFSYVGYSPAKSRQITEKMEAANKAGEFTSEVVESLLAVVTQIGILDADDKPIAITRENLLQIPFEITNEIFQKIVEATTPKKKS